MTELGDDPDVEALAAARREEALATNQRRLLVLAGDRDAGIDAAFDAVRGADVPDDEVTFVTAREGFRFHRVEPKRASSLLGTTRTLVVLDAHEDFSANALGRVAGAVDGGGLLVLLTPPLDEWPTRCDAFDERLAVPPFSVADVTGRFRGRLVSTLRDHPGVALVDLDSGTVERDGAYRQGISFDAAPPRIPREKNRRFPRRAYEDCLTADQSAALAALEALAEPDTAVVVEADRGRGKSSAAGLAAGSLAAEGADVVVTAPGKRNAAEVFARAERLLSELGALRGGGADDFDLAAESGGRVRYVPPTEAGAAAADADALVVDEAAALPVRLLESFLAAPAVAFCTTVRGYEGAGRGFAVRFRDRLDDADREVTDARLDDPIRYAAGDPVESWTFRALLLDARPPVDQLVADATPDTVSYRAFSPDDLLADEHLLREAFGLLVLAHYRTEPDDLARLLDAPNLTLRALTHGGRVVSVALLAREGGLDADTRRHMYDGGRIRGNMLPDVFTSQLRDEAAGVPVGYRVMRIATHHAVRSSGLGSRLLSEVRDEFAGDADYLGVGFGATPELLSFWRDNGYGTVHISTTRNDTSGEYSALMMRPLSPAGRDLRDRHAEWFLGRVGDVLGDALSDLDADVARAALAAVDAGADPSADAAFSPGLSEYEWRVVVGASYGPGLYTTAPGAFRRIGLAHLTNPDRASLTPREERLLVRKVFQMRPWDAVADELDFHSTAGAMRALGDAYEPLVDEYGTDAAREERERFR
ncbi:tRNA(Met) cytidine acetyltransferase [Haloferax sp. Atlit-6N]|uniref:tRNA(Met) cytidine acetyltransferase TmcA n=1 Tax=unclassified Haloferax TaxID=2625095 RepID=UPI000E2277FB|nr:MULTISPECIES: tRNA(Met) cytidine acetyltransferase TmcA [unclassified Haloferax]RDZ52123.1 tRNA(Met) cytidine acetyltransferase [Haloferax sp. Atlit-4N]REA01199.1 tRNA(Met) cytidine acetyltransferase [Haloferax sp. Atlit-6N]